MCRYDADSCKGLPPPDTVVVLLRVPANQPLLSSADGDSKMQMLHRCMAHNACRPARDAMSRLFSCLQHCSNFTPVMQAPKETERPPAPARAPQSPFAEGNVPSQRAPQAAEPEAKPPPPAAPSEVLAADRRAAVEKADALIKHGLEVFNRGQPEQVRHPLLLSAAWSQPMTCNAP